jgi:hypothetical protein
VQQRDVLWGQETAITLNCECAPPSSTKQNLFKQLVHLFLLEGRGFITCY